MDSVFREVREARDELHRFADGRAAAGRAARARQGREALPRGRDRRTFARLVAGLVRTGLAKDHDGILEAAAGS